MRILKSKMLACSWKKWKRRANWSNVVLYNDIDWYTVATSGSVSIRIIAVIQDLHATSSIQMWSDLLIVTPISKNVDDLHRNLDRLFWWYKYSPFPLWMAAIRRRIGRGERSFSLPRITVYLVIMCTICLLLPCTVLALVSISIRAKVGIVFETKEWLILF